MYQIGNNLTVQSLLCAEWQDNLEEKTGLRARTLAVVLAALKTKGANFNEFSLVSLSLICKPRCC